jgi:hypothetical protein
MSDPAVEPVLNSEPVCVIVGDHIVCDDGQVCEWIDGFWRCH